MWVKSGRIWRRGRGRNIMKIYWLIRFRCEKQKKKKIKQTENDLKLFFF